MCVSLLASFLFKIWLQPHDLPSLLNKSFLFASHLSHTVWLLIPALNEFIFSPADKKHGVRFLMPSKITPLCHLSSCRSLFGFKFPPSVLQFSLSSPSSLSLCFLPPSICVYFWLQKTSVGDRERERRNQRWIRQRDGFG